VSGAIDPRKREGLGPWFDRLDEWDLLMCAKTDRLGRRLGAIAARAQTEKARSVMLRHSCYFST
jgi:hypothetical protein